MTKLSELADDVMVFQDDETPISVMDLRNELANGNEMRTEGWGIATPTVWTPDANRMIEDYAENESVDLYEDSYERLMDELSPYIEAIQALLDKIEIPYYVGGEMVEIDSFQPKREEKTNV